MPTALLGVATADLDQTQQSVRYRVLHYQFRVRQGLYHTDHLQRAIEVAGRESGVRHRDEDDALHAGVTVDAVDVLLDLGGKLGSFRDAVVVDAVRPNPARGRDG